MYIPERVSDDEQSYILLVCVPEDFIAFCFDHVTIRKNQILAIEGFLA